MEASTPLLGIGISFGGRGTLSGCADFEKQGLLLSPSEKLRPRHIPRAKVTRFGLLQVARRLKMEVGVLCILLQAPLGAFFGSRPKNTFFRCETVTSLGSVLG